MIKNDVLRVVSVKSGFTQKDVDLILSAYADAVVESFQDGEDKIPLVGLGVFETKSRGARVARNPKTGEAVDVPAKEFLKFRFMPSVKEMVTEEID